MKVAITGASGLIGSALVPFLRAGGHDVVRLVRRPPTGEDEVRWDPEAGEVDRAALECKKLKRRGSVTSVTDGARPSA